MAKPQLTREHVVEALKPQNNCKVKQFLEAMDAESRKVLEEALSLPKLDLPAPRVRDLLVQAGFPEAEVPGTDAIQAHRAGARPCRCKG